jgi:hypothetical protein
MDARQPRQPRATHQLEQKGLCLVILGVPNGNPIGSNRVGRAIEKVVPQPPAGIFDGEPLRGRVAQDIGRLNNYRRLQAFSQSLAELLVPPC